MWRAVALTGAATTLALSAPALAAGAQQISVNGTGGAAVPQGATNAQQQAAYDQALGNAISDAQAKAQMVAQRLSVTLGAVQSFTEQSDDFLGYCGVGFLPGAAATGVSGPAAPVAAGVSSSSQLTPIPARRKHHRSRRKAHKAQETSNTCQVQADVTIVYGAG